MEAGRIWLAKKKGSFARNRITTDNLESRFEAGNDVLDYFDASRAIVTHGGARPGAGRKPTGKVRKATRQRGSARPAIADGRRRTTPPCT